MTCTPDTYCDCTSGSVTGQYVTLAGSNACAWITIPTETWGGSSCIGPTTTAAPHTGKYVFIQTELPVNGPDSIVYGYTSTTTEDVGPDFVTYCVDKTPISTITPAQAIPTAAPQPGEYIYSQTVQPIDGDTAENILIGCTSTTIQSGYWETNTVCVDSTPLATSWATPTAAPAAPQTAPYIYTETYLPVTAHNPLVYACTSTTVWDDSQGTFTYCVDTTPILTMTTPTVTAVPNTVTYVYTESMLLDTDGIDLQLLGCTATTVDVSGMLSATACVGNTTPFTTVTFPGG